MKKALVMLLVLAMLVPMCLNQPAKADAAQPDKPFYSLGWSDFDDEKYQYLDGLYTLNFKSMGSAVGLGGAFYGSDTFDADILALAKRCTAEMQSRPAGARYITTFGPASVYRVMAEDALFFDDCIEQMAGIMDALLKNMKELGAPLDGLVVDLEYVGLSTYYLVDTNGDKYQTNNLLANPDLLRDIVKNPKYKTQIRPLLEEWGFIFYDAGDAAKQKSYTELFSITKNAGSKYARSRNVWNTVTRIHLNNTITQWMYEPLMKYYPEANVSDYQSHDSATWNMMTGTTDDGTVMNGGNSVAAGDTGTTSFYYGSPGNELYHFTGAYEAVYTAGAYKTFLYEVNNAKNLYAASSAKKFAPWITSYYYGGQKSSSPAYTPLYTELLYHLAMLDPMPFLSYTYKPEFTDEQWANTEEIMNNVLAAINEVAGYSDRKPIETPIDWNSKYALSGMYTGGRNLWRITPDTRVISLSEFLVDEETPTFSVNGKTITFPEGKILKEATIKFAGDQEVGSSGFWVETPKDVMPVVTTEAERYEYYPSLIYDFEKYASGAFDYNTATPKDAWGFTWSAAGDVKGESYIVNIDANNKLAIVGNSKNWIKDLPVNVTAGDTFAKDQTWELYVTIPEGLSEDAQIDILTYNGNKQEVADGGFMVKGNKLYYGTGKADAEGNPIYQEMMEVEGDTTYMFKRVMNFHHEGSFYCTYIVGSGSGRVLKTVEEVQCPSFNYITTIGFAVTGANKAVIVDDFKLFQSGVAADFTLYDAKTGQDAELGTLRDRSTAYRLSWLNATYDEHTATIKADITENGKTETTVLKEVTLVPGDDSVVTGIVNVKEGQTVKVYMETTVETPVNPFAPSDEPGPLVDSQFVAGGIQEVPEALKEAGLDTVDKIKEALEAKLQEAESTLVIEGYGHYEVKVNETDVPKNGKMTVIMPYPEGTDASFTFYAAQLYLTDDYGKKIGDIALAEVVNTSEGIQFEIYGTSPVSIGWISPEEVETEDGRIPMPPTDERSTPTAVKVQKPTEYVEEEPTEEIEEPTEYYEETEETEYYEETEPTEYYEESEPTEEPTVEPTEVPDEEEGGVNIILIIAIAVVVLAGAGVATWFLLKKKAAVASADVEEIEEIEESEAPEEKTEE